MAQCHGVLKTLEADRVPAPDSYALLQSAACGASCILQWDNAHDAEDARHTVRSWLEDVKPLHQVRDVYYVGEYPGAGRALFMHSAQAHARA